MTRTYIYINPLTKCLALFLLICVAAAGLSGCGSSGAKPGNTDSPPDPEPILITELDLDYLLSQGLPVILNFGDDSPESLEVLAALERLQKDIGQNVLIRSVDLTQNPAAREGFPIQVMPSQFFYQADGKPIPLPMTLDIIMSSFMDIDTMEPLFTVHEGPLTWEEFLTVLNYVGIIHLEVQ